MSKIASKSRQIARIGYGLLLCVIGLYTLKMEIADIRNLCIPFRNNRSLMTLLAAYFIAGGIVVIALPRQARSISQLAAGNAKDLAAGSMILFILGNLVQLAIVLLMILGFRAYIFA